jgi:hypothetical protein
VGNPKLAIVRNRAVASVKADANRFAKNVTPIIREIQSSGVASHRGIARSLNARGVATAPGGQWTAVPVGSILRRSHCRERQNISTPCSDRDKTARFPYR